MTVQAVVGGKNNKAVRLEGKTPSFQKVYCPDGYPRLSHDVGFAQFLWDRGIHCIAKPLEVDVVRSSATYSWLEGAAPGAATPDLVEQAAHFFYRINTFRDHPDAQKLPTAREACFSYAHHRQCVEARIARLSKGALEPQVRRWVDERLAPAFRRVVSDRRLCDETTIVQRCLSPSDFGFHNTLVEPSGRVLFFDFEYAGWDDPAKMVVDFFCQVQVPVPIEYWEAFCERALLDFDRGVKERAATLLRLYRLKWCCIVLNSALRSGSERRAFASYQQQVEKQLNLSQSILDSVI